MANLTMRVSVTVPKGTKALWKARAKAQWISMSEMIRRATDEDLLAARDTESQ